MTARMVVEDAFVAPGLGLIVTGRVADGPVRLGDRLWLGDGTARHEVTVRDIRTSVCTRFGATGVVEPGRNAGLVLDGVPPGLLPTAWVLTSDGP
ncbi:hypothetical protein GCM10009682_20630 [Luedemannella flava]|uniref:Uncharacterized protein n=1 Tax=Luedemannella flava TaxID=349316 RepID=A0ABN2LTV5_9ACTN